MQSCYGDYISRNSRAAHYLWGKIADRVFSRTVLSVLSEAFGIKAWLKEEVGGRHDLRSCYRQSLEEEQGRDQTGSRIYHVNFTSSPVVCYVFMVSTLQKRIRLKALLRKNFFLRMQIINLNLFSNSCYCSVTPFRSLCRRCVFPQRYLQTPVTWSQSFCFSFYQCLWYHLFPSTSRNCFTCLCDIKH